MKLMAIVMMVALMASGCKGAEVFMQTGQFASFGLAIMMLWATLNMKGKS